MVRAVLREQMGKTVQPDLMGRMERKVLQVHPAPQQITEQTGWLAKQDRWDPLERRVQLVRRGRPARMGHRALSALLASRV